MAKEWYLINTNYDTVSGFEGEDFEFSAQDTFKEALSTAIGEDVEVCNYDLSNRTSVRVIMQGNVQDTKLNSIQRRMLSPIGTCKAGQYVYYKNRYWLIVGLVDDNKIYEKSILLLCNYLLTWKNDEGKIVQRWVSASSASQYNNGETSSKFYFVRSDQLMILTPNDDECLLMKHNQRFIIDKRCEVYEKNFSPNIISDTSKQLTTYELTRIDNVVYNYQDSGHSEFMAYQDEQHENDGYYVIDGKGYWLCDVPCSDNKNTVLSCSIECDEPIIYNGLEPGIFTAKFLDSSGKEITTLPQWEVNCDFVDNLNIEYVENSIFISVDNDKLINKSFELSLYFDEYNRTDITVTIKAFL